MNRLALLCLVPAVLGSLPAQSNTVAGLDGRLTNISNPTYYGRRGPSYPNGEVGMAFANTMCNPGSVNIPWYQAMQPNHPKFGFLIVRVANDKIEQINEWSFCKHAFLSINVNGACGSCVSPGTGSLMGLNCSDTYGASNNASRTWLGPPNEIDPWLGTWNPVGSYFDIGDPSQPGYPAAADGVRSLSQSIFDSVDNRVTIDEIDLTTPNAEYYYGLQLIHEGEALSARGDNLAHRGLNASWSGSSWSFSNNSNGQDDGTILKRWPGATIYSASNGLDDGRFFVASKVTSLGGGNYHYEYAIHNVDNSRAGGGFRIPIDAGATASNYSFGDIDTSSSNDWTVARIGNEIVFTATANNPLEWNTIYNFGFDADFPPGLSTADIPEHRPGAGANEVTIQTEVPGGTTIATFSKFGSGCPVSQMINVPTCSSMNAAGGQLTAVTSPNQYVYRVSAVAGTNVTSFDLHCRSTGPTVTVPAFIYGANGPVPGNAPIATTTITIGPNRTFYTANFSTPVTVSGAFYIGVDNTAQNIVLSDLQIGSFNLGYWRPVGGSTWTLQVMKPSWNVQCTTEPLFPTPVLDVDALPLIGTTYNLSLSDGVATSVAVLVSGLSTTGAGGVPLPGAPGCDLFASPDALDLVPTSATGTASSPITIPNSGALVGLNAYHQWAVLDIPANALGIVVSDAGHATVGS